MFVNSFRTFTLLSLCLLGVQAQQHDGSVRVLFVGDVMLDNGPGHLITNGKDPFEPVAAALHDADLTIGNLECAVTDVGHAEVKPYTFKAPLSSIPLIKKYFSAVSLANNHSGDWGKAGFADELDRLDKAGIPYFGGGRNVRDARRPLILTASGKKIAFLAYNDFPPTRFAAGPNKPGTAWLKEKDVIADIRAARTSADFVLLFFHWGVELVPTPEPYEQELSRKFIEAGADAIIGGHPHIPQTIEWINGRPVVYSLGNFMFDYYPNDPLLWTGWMARLTLGAPGGTKLEIIPVEMDPAGVPHLVPGAPKTYTAQGLVN